MAAAVLGGRLRGREGGVGAAELEDIAALVRRVGELKGVAMKAGQILGYVDPSLPEEARALLTVLHTASTASPVEVVRATLRAELGDRADELLAGMDPRPIAVASIGQVHRAHVSSGDVAVKVRHAGIADALKSDFANARFGASFASMLVPGAAGSVSSFVAEAREAMLEECDFTLEAERQARFGNLLRDHDVIRIPEVHGALSTSAVLTTTFTPGRSLDSVTSQDDRDRLGVALFELYVGTLYRHGVFHADPHPGNYAVLDGAQPSLVVYDFGCVRELDRETVLGLSDLVAAVRSDDRAAMRAALERIGARVPEDKTDVARDLLRGFLAPLLVRGPARVDPGAAMAMKDVMRDKRALLGLGLPGRFLFLFRIRFGLYAVLARLGARADWARLEGEWASAARTPTPATTAARAGSLTTPVHTGLSRSPCVGVDA